MIGFFKKSAKPKSDLVILYGTKSGNAKLVAAQAQKYLQKNGLNPVCVNMSAFKAAQLHETKNLLVVVSTHGEGEPPPTAKNFYKECFSDEMLSLHQLNYSICALGDSSYEEFCGAGKILDERLALLGAKTLHPRVDCDLEYSEDAVKWIKQAVQPLLQGNGKKPDSDLPALFAEQNQSIRARIVKRAKLTSDQALAAVYHLELDLGSDGINYKVGDSVEIKAQNPDWLVDRIIQLLVPGDRETEIRRTLKESCELTSISKKMLQEYAVLAPHQGLNHLLTKEEALKVYVRQANVYDVLNDFGPVPDVDQLLELLPPLRGRQYSIASSPSASPGVLHLCVKTIRFPFQGHEHEGLASVYANEGLSVGEILNLRHIPNESIELPFDTFTPLIMIGVSTGMAPFRALLQERQARKLPGNTWLIWGNRAAEHDFLYREEIMAFRQGGTLEKMDTAFSRDAEGPRYVQEILDDKSAEILDWLERGAHIYLCGSLKMGRAVNETLEILCRNTPHTPSLLMSQKRWHEEVY